MRQCRRWRRLQEIEATNQRIIKKEASASIYRCHFFLTKIFVMIYQYYSCYCYLKNKYTCICLYKFIRISCYCKTLIDYFA